MQPSDGTTHTLKPLREMPRFPVLRGGQTAYEYLGKCWDQSPVMRDRFGGVTSFSLEDLNFWVDDRRTRQVETEGVRASGATEGPTFDFIRLNLLFSNGQIHRNRRGPVARSFAQPVVSKMRPEVAARVEHLVAPLIGQSGVDIMEHLAAPLPSLTIAAIMDAPQEDSPMFAAHAYTAGRAVGICSKAELKEADVALAKMSDYFQDVLSKARANPGDDFMSTYLKKVESGPMTEEEVKAQLVAVVVAGADTTRNSLTALVSQLLSRPDQWAMVVDDPDTHIPGAVSESLRFDPIIGSLARITLEDTEFRGYLIPKDTFVTPSMITALRDPDVYAQPGVFDITRTDHPRLHPTFGAGAHRCLGELLARIELEEALRVLVRMAPDMKLVSDPVKITGFSATRHVSKIFVDM